MPEKANPPGRMPPFVFARRGDLEREAGFLLAGNLITNIPKWKKPTKAQLERINSVIGQLLAQRDTIPAVSITSIWDGGKKPDDGIDSSVLLDDDFMTAYAERHVVVGVRVDPGPASDMKVDSDLARQLGLLRTH